MAEFEGTHQELVNAVMLTAVKMRSIAEEQETMEVAADLHPLLYGAGEVNLVDVCERALEGDPIDTMAVFNILVLANRLADEGSGFDGMFLMRWEADLPEPQWAFGMASETVEEPEDVSVQVPPPVRTAEPPVQTRTVQVPAGEVFAETIDNDGTHRRLGEDWEERPTLVARPFRGETIVCGFRMDWLTGTTDDGVEFAVCAGAGVGSPWLTISYSDPAGTINERIDMRDLATQWLNSIRESLGVTTDA